MQHIIRDWQNQFYTSALLIIVLIIVIRTSIKHRKKFILLRYFPIYAAALLLDFVFLDLYYFAKDANYHRDFFAALSSYIDYFFTLLELIIFSHFYYQVINNRIIKKLIFIFNILFILFFIYMATKDNYFYKDISEATQSIVYTVESIVLLFLCSFYFIELFKRLPLMDLKNEPAFWVSTGVFFFMACTLPYSLLENHIRKNYPNSVMTSYSIFHVFYILLFVIIIRAYLCRPGKMI